MEDIRRRCIIGCSAIITATPANMPSVGINRSRAVLQLNPLSQSCTRDRLRGLCSPALPRRGTELSTPVVPVEHGDDEDTKRTHAHADGNLGACRKWCGVRVGSSLVTSVVVHLLHASVRPDLQVGVMDAIVTCLCCNARRVAFLLAHPRVAFLKCDRKDPVRLVGYNARYRPSKRSWLKTVRHCQSTSGDSQFQVRFDGSESLQWTVQS
jgi:hypothetical protein